MKKIRLLRQSMLAGISILLLSSSLVLASPTLRQGSTGHDVMLLQKKLHSVGYNINSIDGVYGAETEQAVDEFQRDQKIRITGIVNNATWRALKNSKKRPWGSSIKKPATNNHSTTLAPNNRPILARSKVNSLFSPPALHDPDTPHTSCRSPDTVFYLFRDPRFTSKLPHPVSTTIRESGQHMGQQILWVLRERSGESLS